MSTDQQREAERLKKQRQRQGYKTRPIVLQDEMHIPALVVMGFLTDAQIEDEAAINDAYAAVIRHYCHLTRFSSSDSAVRCLHEWAEETRADPEWQEKEKRHRRRLEEGGSSDLGVHTDHDRPMPYVRRPGDNRSPKVSDLPHIEPERRRSGRNGRNPGYLRSLVIRNARDVVIGKYESPALPRTSGKKVKQLSPAELKKREKEYGPFPTDTGIHTVSMSNAEKDSRLDDLEWQERGEVKRRGRTNLDLYEGSDKEE